MNPDFDDTALWKAYRTAVAMGSRMVLGVRPDGSWFAHCEGVEFDASKPVEAVESVTNELAKRLRDTISAGESSARSAKTKLANLVG